MRPPCIYFITNWENGKRYIGSTVNFPKRKNAHLSCLRRGVHTCLPLQRSFNKWGEEAFGIGVVSVVDGQDLLHVEQKWLDLYCPEYNLAKFANSPMLGRRQSEQAKRKLSDLNKGKLKTYEHRQRISASLRGRPLSKEAIEKRTSTRIARKIGVGIPRSMETRAKISAAMKKRLRT